MKKILTPLALLVSLSGCDILFPEDPRIGVESPEKCLERVASERRDEVFDFIDEGDLWVPTYTYDVTKLDLATIQELSVPGSNETEGTRLTLSTNEASTAVAQFMEQPVDEKGAFFMAHDPALYRVRGEPLLLAEVIPAGCARQRAGMRLIKVDFAKGPLDPTDTDQSDETSSNTESD